MSAVTLCDPSMTDGAIKLRVIKTLLRKFRGKIFAKCCGYADTYIPAVVEHHELTERSPRDTSLLSVPDVPAAQGSLPRGPSVVPR